MIKKWVDLKIKLYLVFISINLLHFNLISCLDCLISKLGRQLVEGDKEGSSWLRGPTIPHNTPQYHAIPHTILHITHTHKTIQYSAIPLHNRTITTPYISRQYKEVGSWLRGPALQRAYVSITPVLQREHLNKHQRGAKKKSTNKFMGFFCSLECSLWSRWCGVWWSKQGSSF